MNEPPIESRSAFRVVGIQVRAGAGGLNPPEAWAQLWPRVGEIHDQAGDGAYGVSANFDPASGSFDYLAGVRVTSDAAPPPGMHSAFLPTQRCAVFTCTLATLMQVLHAANHEWLPASAFQRGDGPEIEWYPPAFDGADPASTFTISIPVSP